MVSPEELLKFYVDKDVTKNSLSFQLTSISGNIPVLKDKKTHNLSLTRIGEKRKRIMAEPVETIVIHAQQNFEVAGGLNPVHNEIDDNRVLKKLKKYKNAAYKLTPLGILFPVPVKNDTVQIFLTCTELNDVKNWLINNKIYGLLQIIDLKEINNWEEIKGQSLWINATLEEQKEINNSRHLCFLFSTLSLNDLLNFSTILLDSNNKEIEFNANEKKKISVFNFKIDLFLR